MKLAWQRVVPSPYLSAARHIVLFRLQRENIFPAPLLTQSSHCDHCTFPCLLGPVCLWQKTGCSQSPQGGWSVVFLPPSVDERFDSLEFIRMVISRVSSQITCPFLFFYKDRRLVLSSLCKSRHSGGPGLPACQGDDFSRYSTGTYLSAPKTGYPLWRAGLRICGLTSFPPWKAKPSFWCVSPGVQIS